MKITIGKFYTNKTKLYLFPLLRYYPQTFKTKLNNISKLAVGVYDLSLPELFMDKCIYILIDTRYRSYDDFARYTRNCPFYVKDYSYDRGSAIFVIRMIDELEDKFDHFVNGKYSKMYTQKDITFLLKAKKQTNNLYFDRQYNVLKRTKRAYNNFLRNLNEEYNTVLTEKDIIFNELELPLKTDEEIFNCKTSRILNVNKLYTYE